MAHRAKVVGDTVSTDTGLRLVLAHRAKVVGGTVSTDTGLRLVLAHRAKVVGGTVSTDSWSASLGTQGQGGGYCLHRYWSH